MGSGASDSRNGDAGEWGIERGGCFEESTVALAGREMSRVTECRRRAVARNHGQPSWDVENFGRHASNRCGAGNGEGEEGGMPESLQFIAACAPSSVPLRAFAA